MIFIKGLFYGIGVSFLLGTVFFALLQQGFKFGWRAGFFIALGVVFTDSLFITLVVLFTDWSSGFIQNNRTIITLFGAVFIIFLGFMGLIRAIRKQQTTENLQRFIPIKLFTMGVILNLANPANFFVWLGLQVLLLAQNYSFSERFQFFGASLLAIFIAEVFIASFAFYFKSKLQSKSLYLVQRGINLIFIAIGISLLIKLSF